MRPDARLDTRQQRFGRTQAGTFESMLVLPSRPVPMFAWFLAICLLALALPSAGSAAAPKLVVTSPGNGSISAAVHPLKMRLKTDKRSRVRSASFYAQGQLVSTDTRAPFTATRGRTLDLRSFESGPAKLRFKVVYTLRGGKTKTKSRQVRVLVFRPPTPEAPLPAAHWRPAFSDDFTSSASFANWKTQRDDWIKHGIPYSNLEGAGYLTSNVRIANGTMNISTSSHPAAGFTQSTGSVNTNKRFAFKYGYLEARLLIPRCNGCWPAFWMLPSADHWPPEIDIIEYFNTAKQVIPYSAVHWATNEPDKEDYFSERLMFADTDNYIGTWHTYGVLWSASSVQFYLDGRPGPVFSEPSKIPHLPMYPIIQLAVGNGFRPGPGHTMQVDYVRAWTPAS